MVAKRLELLHELVPGATRVAVLVNSAAVSTTETTLKEVAGAGRTRGLQIQVFNASTSRDINAAFAAFVRERSDALYVGGDAFFRSDVPNWSIWRRATRSPRPMAGANLFCRAVL